MFRAARAHTAWLALSLLLTAACSDDGGDPTDEPAVDADNDGYTTADDCDDSNPDINPGATEDCEQDIDLNCDGDTEFDDQDKDGFAQCVDCNDLDNQIKPGAAEVCDEVDNDCDELIDDADDDLTGGTEFFADTDEDELGDAENSTFACEQPEGYVDNDLDCDDTDENSGAAGEWFEDSDEDGYGATTSRRVACEQPTGHVAQGGDCNDGDKDIHPDAIERCDDVDNNCNGKKDDEDETLAEGRLGFVDADGDGHGDEEDEGRFFCDRPDGYARDNEDCDDSDKAVNPDMPFDFDDDVDNDCDEAIDEDVGDETYSHDADIQSIWNANCTRCHGSSGGLSLASSAHGRIVGGSSSLSGYDYIEPGLPSDSYLFLKIEGTHTAVGGTGVKMPRGGSLSSSDVVKIRTWIEEGAVK